MSMKMGFDCFLFWFIPIAPTKPNGKGHLFKVYDEKQMMMNNQSRDHSKKDDKPTDALGLA